MLKDGSRIGFIIPYPFLNENYAKILRKSILDTCAIEVIVDLSGYKVFEAATVDTCIIILRKASKAETGSSHAIRIVRQDSYSLGIQSGGERIIRQSVFGETLQNSFRLDLNDASITLLGKIDDQSIKVGDLCYVITGAVLHDSKTGASKDRLIHQKEKPGYKPYVEAKEISRYVRPRNERFLDYRPKEMHRPKFPELFENTKVMVQMVAGNSGLIATYDDTNLYTDHSLHLCVMKHLLHGVKRSQIKITEEEARLSTPYDPKFLLAHINSRLVGYYFQQQLEGGINVYPETVRQLPIRVINFDDLADKARHNRIVETVDEMVALQQESAEAEVMLEDRRHDLAREIEKLDAQIDQLVYELYGLSEDEIALIEESA